LHIGWEEIKFPSKEVKKLVEDQLKHQLKQVAEQVKKSRGTIPGELKDIIDNILKKVPPIFNWKAYLRRMLGHGYEIYTKSTRKVPSFRFEDSSSLKIRKRQNILVGVDTSGSVSEKELKEFFQEIYHVWKAKATIDVLECDAQTYPVKPYKGKFDGKVSGRGGTDFEPVIKYYNDHIERYDLCVFFTDGGAPIPKEKPRKKMIWVISSNGDHETKFPGHVIHIPKENEE